MELNRQTKRHHSFLAVVGLISFLLGLFSLAGLNAGLILKTDIIPGFLFYQLPFLGLFLGLIGLFTGKRSRLYAFWGIALNAFILVFITMMFILAWMINVKP
ncbi:hypothetical protein [Lederbergia galactosidilytica]|uniref:Uncharacterized protein n=1 Tax=Lederbergia galactosidilytica TaxID=217031 RepID=A0A0Q9XXX1_9BACI|nr:hypothetical protein [Lederbergia galactosidilytica]KRG12584.1 hypothetical protein ACA30_18370 [Virgibacillus soli]KRG13616.1 hypothetical protein ACA29_07950 [Lederbergia galactosidilytica]MBP1916052.1 hypothetical protein [Lederbergia galactosidilytica]OAK68471.1 hypothetical protein ABB05_15435 [Lederbergia galactosidilytica]